MHSSGSILRTFCEKVRMHLDDPDLDAKYDNDYLVRLVLTPCMVDVMTRINMMADNPVILRHTITFSDTVEYYTLPPSMKEVWRLAALNEDGRLTREVFPRNEFNWRGPAWKVEGNQLAIRPRPILNDTYDLWYVPSGDIEPHLSTDGQLDADFDTLTLGSTLSLGRLDPRPHAYAGMYLRMIHSGETHEDRVIASHDESAGTVTVRTAFDNQTDSIDRQYEIVPFLMEPMLEAISLRAAMKLGVGRRASTSHQQLMQIEYRSAIKTAYDITSNLMQRYGKHYDRHTTDNREEMSGFRWGTRT
jgi:hypothetical protein